METSNKMRIYGEKMEDVMIVEKILRSVAPKFDFVVCAIEESKNLATLSLDEMQSFLLVHEQKINRSTIAEEQALKASVNTYSNSYKDEVETEEEEIMEVEILAGISISVMTNFKAEAKVETMTNQRWSVFDAINLVIMHLSVIVGCLLTKRRKRVQSSLRRMKRKYY